MECLETTLPWNVTPVLSLVGTRDYLAARVPRALHHHLPRAVTLYCDPCVSRAEVGALVAAAADFLAAEYAVREERLGRFKAMGLFGPRELRAVLAPCHAQDWALYYSAGGGLGEIAEDDDATTASFGVVPCSTMPNHGVGWRRGGDGAIRTWLATAPKTGCAWDSDSDFGHESAHAAFAPIPLFAQGMHHRLEAIRFSHLRLASDVEDDQLARMGYLLTELSVVAVRGERRATETGLPIGEPDELHAFLWLADELMPGLGFATAASAYEGVGGVVNLDAPEAFFIGAAALRAVSRIAAVVATPHVAEVAHRVFNLPAHPGALP